MFRRDGGRMPIRWVVRLGLGLSRWPRRSSGRRRVVLPGQGNALVKGAIAMFVSAQRREGRETRCSKLSNHRHNGRWDYRRNVRLLVHPASLHPPWLQFTNSGDSHGGLLFGAFGAEVSGMDVPVCPSSVAMLAVFLLSRTITPAFRSPAAARKTHPVAHAEMSQHDGAAGLANELEPLDDQAIEETKVFFVQASDRLGCVPLGLSIPLDDLPSSMSSRFPPIYRCFLLPVAMVTVHGAENACHSERSEESRWYRNTVEILRCSE